MGVLKKNYTDLNDCLRHIRYQVEDSRNFAKNFVPKFNNPIEFFFWLKPYLNYQLDPDGTELLQSFQTLINKNYYGQSGRGDCDCFTIAQLSACIEQKWKECEIWIKLCGRNKTHARHIYGGVDFKGKEIALDFTNKLPGVERFYPYVQKIYLKKLR